jgi:hypothetical protein
MFRLIIFLPENCFFKNRCYRILLFCHFISGKNIREKSMTTVKVDVLKPPGVETSETEEEMLQQAQGKQSTSGEFKQTKQRKKFEFFF